MKCCHKDPDCLEPAAFRFTWPGRAEMGACAEHARKLREVAQAVGFALELIPVRSAFSDALDQAGFVGWQPSPEVRVAIEAVARIVDERTRQTRAEGYTAAHDDEHDEGELAKAAVCYAIPSDARAMVEDPCWLWPFEPSSFKPSRALTRGRPSVDEQEQEEEGEGAEGEAREARQVLPVRADVREGRGRLLPRVQAARVREVLHERRRRMGRARAGGSPGRR
jgi:hypothetical protein